MPERIVTFENNGDIAEVFGNFDNNLKRIEEEYGVRLVFRDSGLKITGDDDESVNLAAKVMGTLVSIASKGEPINDQNLNYIIGIVNDRMEESLSELRDGFICITAKGRPIKAKTVGQQKYVDAISKNTVTLGIGPAGTGKTFLAVAMAVSAFREKKCSRIIITRPAVEAGEKLGFLPGDLQNKVDPYLRPLHDALFEMLGVETYQKYLERGSIEVAPLAYMRGRTLDDSFIILDEAQNTTPEQMKMFLTRLGFGSRVVVTGDVTQIDLPFGKKSGLVDAVGVLKGVDDIATINLTEKDVVRHVLVQKIILAYEKSEGKRVSRGRGVRDGK